jgi:hypothetical protein
MLADLTKGIESSLTRLYRLAKEEPDDNRTREILKWRDDRIGELRGLANRLDNYESEI